MLRVLLTPTALCSVQSDFDPDCPRVLTLIVFGFFNLKVGCPIVPREIILAEFRRCKEINDNEAYSACFKVVKFFGGEVVQLVGDFSEFPVSVNILDLCVGNVVNKWI